MILKYPVYTSEEILQKIRKKTTDQTIKENNKLNVDFYSVNLEHKTANQNIAEEDKDLLKYVGFVQRGQRAVSITDDMVRNMYQKKLITEEQYNSW